MSDLRQTLSRHDDYLAPMVRINDTTGCWEWQGYRQREGYGQLRRSQRTWQAHRYVWTLLQGPIPPGVALCHRCDNPPCVNPEHIFLGDARANIRDCVAKGRYRNALMARTHCPQGHELSGDNLLPSKHGWRVCRECNRQKCRRRRLAKKEAHK